MFINGPHRPHQSGTPPGRGDSRHHDHRQTVRKDADIFRKSAQTTRSCPAATQSFL